MMNEMKKLTNDVARLQMEQEDAIGLIRGTIQRLTVVNDKLSQKSTEINARVASLKNLDTSVQNTKKDNEALIKNFSKLLEV